MRLYDRLINAGLLSNAGWLSRRRLIVGGAVGLLAVSASAEADGQTEAPPAPGGTVEDQLAIEQLLYRYAMALDTREAGALADCFADEVLTRDLAEKTVEFHRLYEHTIHHVLNHRYTVHGRTATGTHYSLVSYVKKTAGKLIKFETYARYEHDQLVKHGGRWLFGKLRQWTPLFSTEDVPVQPDLPAGFRETLTKIFRG